MKPIQILDLSAEHAKQRQEIDDAIAGVISTSDFIKGEAVGRFEKSLQDYLKVSHVIGVGNGTDALQIALMALGVKAGDEVILPSFTYYATAEAVAVLGAVPVFVDVDMETFTIIPELVAQAVTEKTKAIIAVHLYGHPADMNRLSEISKTHNIPVIEDNAQAIGASIQMDGVQEMTGSIGDIACFSFFPSKNLGALGDGGALSTNNSELADTIRMIANHGQSKKYVHDRIGMNSRLDSIQAVVLDVKLKVLEEKTKRRQEIARYYSSGLAGVNFIITPVIGTGTSHVFHQYTIQVGEGKRDSLQKHLITQGIPARVYYPIPVHQQKGMGGLVRVPNELNNTEELTDTVLSLPVHSEMEEGQMEYVVDAVVGFNESMN